MLRPLVVIVGPTAVGKTGLAIEVAKRIASEIISGDSMQVYRYMNIGTAKATKKEQEGIPHHMIDILNPDEDFSVALFQKRVEKLVEEISGRGKLPILVGGTGLYVRSVIDHYNFSETAIDLEFRAKLKKDAEELGSVILHKRLAQVDLEAANKIHPNDTKRIIRALEVFHHTGVPITSFQDRDMHINPKYNLLMYGLNMEREKLYDGINKRVDMMVEKGLVAEVEGLLSSGFKPGLTSMQAIGYKEVIDYLDGKFSLEEAIEGLKQNTRRFAKRQLTWFRRDKRIKWFEVKDSRSLIEIADEIEIEICRTIFKDVE